MLMRSGGWIKAGSAMAMLALVSGCALLDEITAPSPKPAAAPAPPASAATASESAKTAAVPPAPPPPAPPPRERPQSAPVPDFDPARLVGLDKDETLATLGQPAAVREQPPATVWTYRTRDCAVDLFFYMDLATRAFRVLTTEVTTDLKSPDARRVCLNRLRSASRGQ
jgi:hypothetical protein